MRASLHGRRLQPLGPASLPLLLALGVALVPQVGEANGNVRVVTTSVLSSNTGGLSVEPYSFGEGVAELGDFDGDGIPDLASTGSSGVFVLRMAADGSVKPGGATTIARNEDSYYFGPALESLGDLDGDGASELAVGSPYDTVSGLYGSGRVTIVFFNPDGTQKKRQLLDRANGTLPFAPAQYDNFGNSLARIDDMDGDGIPELAVGMPGHDGIDTEAGAVAVLFLNALGTVKSARILEAADSRYLGLSLAPIGDFDGDSVPDLASGVSYGQGELWLLYLNADGTLKSRRRIDGTSQDFSGYLGPYDGFGSSVASLGDADGDGVTDLAVGASGDEAVWTLLFNADGTVKAPNKTTLAGEGIPAADGEGFGSSIALVGDLDGNGTDELVVGASGGNALWLFFRDAAGANLSHVELSKKSGGFGAYLSDLDRMGASLARLGDLDGDGSDEILAGAPNVAESTELPGSVWILYPAGSNGVSQRRQLTDAFGHGMQGLLDPGDRFGAAVAATGDLDGDGVVDFVAGAPGDDDGGPDRGAVWIVLLRADGAVKERHKLSSTAGSFAGPIADGAGFGGGVASVGDLDGDGNGDIAVADGQLWILFLTDTFTVKSQQRLAVDATNLAAVEDVDGDGRIDLALGQPDASPHGAVDIVFLNADGSVRTSQRVDEAQGGFAAVLEAGSRFGRSVSSVGDLDDDGVPDLAVGAATPGDGDYGALWLVFLRSDGTVRTARKVGNNKGGLSPSVLAHVQIGSSAARTSDLDGDGTEDLVIGNALAPSRSYSPLVPGELYLSTLAPICDPQPRDFCLGGVGKLTLKRSPGRNPKNSLRWSLGAGDTTPREAFGGNYYGWPDYALCLYDASASVREVAAAWLLPAAPGYTSRWAQTSSGARYDDRYEGATDGIRQVLLTAGEQGKTRMQVRALGGAMVLPGAVTMTKWLDADPSVVVQLTNSTGACWSTELGRIQFDSAVMFKAQQ